MIKLHRHSTINESVVKRKKDQEVFNYSSIVDNAWVPVIKAAQKFQNINFDLENNDPMSTKKLGSKRTIFIKKDLRVDQPIKYEINLEMMRAGGDWEMPVLYFKVELTHDYGITKKGVNETIFDQEKDYTGLYKCYVMIPDNDTGNMLKRTENGWTAYTDEFASEDGMKSKEFNITDERIELAWNWIEDFFEHIVNERHEMLDKPNGSDDKHDALPAEQAPEDTNESLTHLTQFKMFEGMDPVKQLTEIVLQKEVNTQVKIFITIDNRMNKITDVRSPGGIRHIFRRGNILNKHQMENWMETNGFVEAGRRSIKKALKGNELVKFMMKKGYR